MFCPECGSKNDDNAAFCCECGAALQTPDTAAASPAKKNLTLSSNDKILLIELVIALFSVILFFVMYHNHYSAGNIAEKYVKAGYEQDWNALYDTLYLENEDDFTTKEAFITAQKINASENKQYVSILDVTKLSGGASGKAYRVSYQLDGYSDSTVVELKRNGLSWKVSNANYTSNDYMIPVPTGAAVTLDKIDVSGSLKPSEKMEGFDTYIIPQVFGATHYIELSGEELEDAGQLLTYYGGDSAESNLYSSMVTSQYNEETIETVMKLAEADLKEILEAASANKKFSDVPAFEHTFANCKEYVINSYEYLRDNSFGNGNSNYSLTKYTLSNGEMNGSVINIGGSTLIKVVIKGNYSYESASISWGGSTYTDSGDGTCAHTLAYTKAGDDWMLYSLEIDMGGI